MENGGKMENPGDIYQLCRLCLANKQVNVPIFGEKSDIRQISLKISSCLPVKIAVDDSLPKSICEGCSDKLELFYAFWNSSQEADKTLRAWIEQIDINNASETISAVVKQIANSEIIPLAIEQISNSKGIPLVTEVKEEIEDLTENDQDKVIIDQSFDDDEDVDEKESEEDAPPPKKARYSPTEEDVNINRESDDDDNEEYDGDEVEPKVEDESDISDSEEDEPLSSRLGDKPGTSKDEEQAGPSGVGKDGEKFLQLELMKKEELDTSDVDEPELITDSDISIINILKETEPKKYKCARCPTSFAKKQAFDEHMNTHTKQKKYECEQCPAVFYRKSNLEKHRKVHEVFKATSVICTICNVWCKNLKALQMHKITHEASHKCDMCPKTFPLVSNLLSHKAIVHHNPDGVLRCPCCEHIAKNRWFLLEHIRTHTLEPKYSPNMCLECGEVFSKRYIMQKHIERVHQPKKDFNCDLCSSVFDTSVALKHHKRRHLMKPCHVCGVCERGFTTKYKLTCHTFTHSQERKFKCTICVAKYKRKRDLNNHLKTHANKQ